MGQILGKITVDEPEGPRGPDLMHRIDVPAAWFEEGASLELEMPRRLACARCEGGGCDICGRAGAFALRGPDEPPECLRVSLPRAPEVGVVVLKIPDAGAPPPTAEAANEVENGPVPEPEVAPAEAGVSNGSVAPAAPMKPSSVTALAVLGEQAELTLSPPRGETQPLASPEPSRDGPGARGTLFLRVGTAATPSPGVRRTYGVESAAALSDAERRKLMRRSGLMLGGLLILFLVMLWLSGWL